MVVTEVGVIRLSCCDDQTNYFIKLHNTWERVLSQPYIFYIEQLSLSKVRKKNYCHRQNTQPSVVYSVYGYGIKTRCV